MIPVCKRVSPPSLERKRLKAIEDGLSDTEAYRRLKDPLKSEIRKMLLEDQGQICVYCMCRIPRADVPDKIPPVIIEHFTARNPLHGDSYLGLGLDYRNLFVACHGNRAPKGVHKAKDLTCDAHRGNEDFRKINPCDASTLSTIFYDLEGHIDAADSDVKYDLVNILNLNCTSSSLIGERRGALEALMEDMGEIKEDELLEYCILRLKHFENEKLIKTPYVGILIWYLKGMIDALQCADAD